MASNRLLKNIYEQTPTEWKERGRLKQDIVQTMRE